MLEVVNAALTWSGWFLFAANVVWACQLARWWRTLRQYQKTLDETHQTLARCWERVQCVSYDPPPGANWIRRDDRRNLH